MDFDASPSASPIVKSNPPPAPEPIEEEGFEREDEDDHQEEPVGVAPTTARPETSERPGRGERRERSGRGDRGERGERRERRDRPESYSTPELAPAELEAQASRVTTELLQAMGFEPTVNAKAEGTRVEVTVEVSQDDDLLTGHKGETRQALQQLLNRYVNRSEGNRYHLQLEINDFWQRREDELRDLATGLATEAVEKQAEVITDYLNSQERRIIHVTLKEDARVRTYALGTGMIKRVAIAPASFPERSEDDFDA